MIILEGVCEVLFKLWGGFWGC